MDKRIWALIFAGLGIASIFIDGDATFAVFALCIAWITFWENQPRKSRRESSRINYTSYNRK